MTLGYDLQLNTTIFIAKASIPTAHKASAQLSEEPLIFNSSSGKRIKRMMCS